MSPFTVTSSSLRPGPTSPSTSQRSRDCRSLAAVPGTTTAWRNDRIMAHYPVHGLRQPGERAGTGVPPVARLGHVIRYIGWGPAMAKLRPQREPDATTVQAAVDAFPSS